MKIHSNVIGYTQIIREALKGEKAAGRIASHVTFKSLEQRGSRSHEFAFEIQLEANERDNGRRAGNSGSYGAMRPEVDGYAATYDEWGFLLNALFALDPKMVVGTAKYATYRGREDFDQKTGWTYNYDRLLAHFLEWPAFDGSFDRDPFPCTEGYTANRIGRRGFGRKRAQDMNPQWRHVSEAPRDSAWVRKFAHLADDYVPAEKVTA